MNLNTTRMLGFCVAAILLLTASTFGGPSPETPAPGAETPSAALLAEVPAPIDISLDGELLLLFLPGGQGFELVNTSTSQRDVVSATPNTGYFASISPDKKYVCFKDFQPAGNALLQVPALYDIAEKKVVLLDKPASAAGNPMASSRGQIAYTIGEQLIVLNSDLGRSMEIDLGVVVNVLAFSPNGQWLAFSDPNETISWIDLEPGTRSGVPMGALHGYQPRFSPDGQALLARSSSGEITGWHRATGLSRNFGRAEAAAWLDNDIVVLVRKDVANFVVTHTHVEKRKLSDGSTSTLLTRKGDAEFALNAAVMASVADDGITLADTQTGQLDRSAIQSPPAAVAASATTPAPVPLTEPSGLSPLGVVTNGTTVQLSGVLYVNQVYDTDDDFAGGYSCCNATATLMAIQYYCRLPARPITCTRGGTHTSQYGFYISSKYSYNGCRGASKTGQVL